MMREKIIISWPSESEVMEHIQKEKERERKIRSHPYTYTINPPIPDNVIKDDKNDKIKPKDSTPNKLANGVSLPEWCLNQDVSIFSEKELNNCMKIKNIQSTRINGKGTHNNPSFRCESRGSHSASASSSNFGRAPFNNIIFEEDRIRESRFLPAQETSGRQTGKMSDLLSNKQAFHTMEAMDSTVDATTGVSAQAECWSENEGLSNAVVLSDSWGYPIIRELNQIHHSNGRVQSLNEHGCFSDDDDVLDFANDTSLSDGEGHEIRPKRKALVMSKEDHQKVLKKLDLKGRRKKLKELKLDDKLDLPKDLFSLRDNFLVPQGVRNAIPEWRMRQSLTANAHRNYNSTLLAVAHHLFNYMDIDLLHIQNVESLGNIRSQVKILLAFVHVLRLHNSKSEKDLVGIDQIKWSSVNSVKSAYNKYLKIYYNIRFPSYPNDAEWSESWQTLRKVCQATTLIKTPIAMDEIMEISRWTHSILVRAEAASKYKQTAHIFLRDYYKYMVTVRNSMMVILSYFGIRRLDEALHMQVYHVTQTIDKASGARFGRWTFFRSKTGRNNKPFVTIIPSFEGKNAKYSPWELLKLYQKYLKELHRLKHTNFRYTAATYLFSAFSFNNKKAKEEAIYGKPLASSAGLVNQVFDKVLDRKLSKEGIVMSARKGGASFYCANGMREVATQAGLWAVTGNGNSLCHTLYHPYATHKRLGLMLSIVATSFKASLAIDGIISMEEFHKKATEPGLGTNFIILMWQNQSGKALARAVLKIAYLVSFVEFQQAAPSLTKWLESYATVLSDNSCNALENLAKWLERGRNAGG